MNRKLFLAAGCSLALLAGMCGCSGYGPAAEEPGRRVVKRIPAHERPDWMKSVRNFWIQNGTIYYYGVADGARDLKSSLENAEADAAAGLAEQLKTMLRTEYTTAIGKRKLHQATRQTIEQTLAVLLDEMVIPGGAVAGHYSEKTTEARDGKTRVVYRSWVLSSIEASEYDALLYRVAVSMKAEVKTDGAAVRIADAVERKYKPAGKQEV